jgi:predicted restriction endonuclease
MARDHVALHYKLFDRGVIGISDETTVAVSRRPHRPRST